MKVTGVSEYAICNYSTMLFRKLCARVHSMMMIYMGELNVGFKQKKLLYEKGKVQKTKIIKS
jgi:hypothetical protein